MSLGIPQDLRRYLTGRGTSVIGEDDADHQPIHVRAILIGAFLSFFLGVAANYADIIIRGSYLSLHFSTTGAILLLLVLVGGLNVLFKITAGRLWVAIVIFVLVTVAYVVHFAPFDAMLAYSPGVLFSSFMVGVLALNIVLIAIVFYLIARNLLKLAYEHRHRTIGVRLKTKLITAFVILSLPAMGFHLFASTFIARTLESWLEGQHETVV